MSRSIELCWACVDENGRKSLYFGPGEPEYDGHEWCVKSKRQLRQSFERPCNRLMHAQLLFDMVFPKGLRSGTRKLVRVNAAEIVDTDTEAE